MKQKLQWKIVLLFFLLIISVMIIAGTFLLNSITMFYHRQFQDQMNREFNGQIGSSLSAAAGSLEQVRDITLAYSTSRLGINSNRNYYILSGDSAQVLASSSDSADDLEISANILSAMAGEVGDSVSIRSEYMDYAYPVKAGDKVQYIVYIKDLKQDVREILHSMFLVILQAMLVGSLIALVIGYFMSKTITVPIRNLTTKAGRMASGNFDSVMEVRGGDEISELTATFNVMAVKLQKTLKEIEGERDKIEIVIRNMEDGVMAFDEKGVSTHINPAAHRLLALKLRKYYRFHDVFKPLGITLTLKEVLSGGESVQREWQAERKGVILHLHFAPFRAGKDKPENGVIVTIQDITKQEKLENSRRTFVADVSHELRTPLTNIKSYTETLLEADIDDKETERSFLEVIDSETDRMTRLVKDLLTLSKLDHAKSAFEFTDVSMAELATGVIKKMEMDAKNNGLTITYMSGSAVPAVPMDKDRMEQVVVNILSNAIKYTPSGGSVTVLCGQQNDQVYLKVTDTGIGIPEKDLPMLFERFYRVDKARSREKGGTGLGLAIAKEIVEAHDGSISIESVYGEGTTVTVKLPMEQGKRNK